jgi:hypothetical protein
MKSGNELTTVDLDFIRRSREEWMSVRDAARVEGRTPGRIYQLIKAGERRAVRFAGAIIVIPKRRSGRPPKQSKETVG